MGKVYPGIHGMRKYVSTTRILRRSLKDRENDRSLIFGDDEKFWSALWKYFYGGSLLFFFLCRLINEKSKWGRWIITDAWNSIFGTTRNIISKRFYGRWSLLFFFFLMINKVDPNGEKMDYCTRLWITRNIFIYDRYFFSQAIKNSGSKWRRWIIVVANLEFNFWERFFFLFFLFLPSRMIIERIQYPSFATFWKQMEGKLASGSCISGNFHPDIFIRAADNVESPRTKRFRGRSWWNGKSFSFSFA